MYIRRKIDKDLSEWALEKEAKPLLIRGARQVGKSTAVRQLAETFDHFLEINFEARRQIHTIFEGDLDPTQICEQLSLLFNIPIIPGKTLLFFDEIQACIPAISSLRFFYEQMPQLHVIAAGSLLEFALAEIPSFGVGRIRSMFLYPLSLDEFLDATGEHTLLEAKKKGSPEAPLSEPVHQKLINITKRFLVLGGMPEVVAAYIQQNDLTICGRVMDDLIISMKSDFAKYKNKVPYLRIAEVFDAVVLQSGGKFVYAKAASQFTTKQTKEALDLLIMAGIVIPVTHTSANGIPLGAEINPKHRKMLLMDTGIFQRLQGLNIGELLMENNFDVVNKGSIAEQYTGLELMKSASCYRPESLYFWHREAKSSNAEVDYVIQRGEQIIPIEVKSGTKGSMRSLHIFISEKKSKAGIRISLENYSVFDDIEVIPLYGASDILNNLSS
jgi:predicted AAA+ superfamily ATPase